MVGYIDQEFLVNNSTTLNVRMKNELLKELVVVGYGTQESEDITGSIVKVESDWSSASYDSEGSDIWGWRNTSTGVEYALVGLNTGFSVVELSNPQNPTEVFFIPGANTTWRDIKTWENYAYIVCDNCNDGLLIVDLNDMSGQTYFINTEFFNKAHNIFRFHSHYISNSCI